MDRRNKLTEKDYQNIIKTARVILVKNIVPCKQLYENLKEFNVFPETMLDDIQVCPSNEEKNTMLVDLLLVRGKQVAQLFADALHLSGHGFLSDFLTDEFDMAEEGKPPQIEVDKKNLSKKIPRIDMILPEKEKEELISYIRTRIKEEVISDKWSKMRDTEKIMNVRQAQLEQSSHYKGILKEQDAKINKMQLSLDTALAESENKASEIKQLSNYIGELEKNHKKNIDAQMQYNSANDKSLQRLTEKDQIAAEKLHKMIRDMEKCIQDNNDIDESGKNEQESEESELQKYQLQHNPLDKSRATLDRLFEMVNSLRKIKERCFHLEYERSTLIAQFGTDCDGLSLTEAFRKHVMEKEQKLEKLSGEIREKNKVLKEKEDLESDSVTHYKKEVEKLTDEIAAKSDVIRKLNEENKKLNTRVNYLKSLVNEKESRENLQVKTKSPVVLSSQFENFKSVDTTAASEGLLMHDGTGPKLRRPKEERTPRIATKKEATTKQVLPMKTFEHTGATLTISSIAPGHGGYKQALDASVPGSGRGLPALNKNVAFSGTKSSAHQEKQ